MGAGSRALGRLGLAFAVSAFALWGPTAAADTGTPPPIGPGDGEGQSAAVESSIAHREMYGFETDSATMTDLWDGRDDLQAWSELGVLATDEEREHVLEMTELEYNRNNAVQLGREMPGFAGASFDPVVGKLHLYFTPAGLAGRQKVIAGSNLPAHQLELHYTATATLAELEAARGTIQAAATEEGWASTLSGIAIDEVHNGLVVVRAPTAAPAAAQAFSLESDDDFGVDVDVTVIDGTNEEDVAVQAAFCNYRDACVTPQRGGTLVYNHLSNTSCSSGFAVRKANGNEYLLTAGHCWWRYSNEEIWGTRLGDPIGFSSTNALMSWSTADARLIDTPNSTTEPWIYWSNTDRQHFIIGKRHRNNILTGDTVCVRGHPMPTRSCGRILYTSYDSTSPACGCTVLRSMLADYTSVGGLSGGAVVTSDGNTALGINSGTSAGLARFSPISEVESRLAVTVQTK